MANYPIEIRDISRDLSASGTESSKIVGYSAIFNDKTTIYAGSPWEFKETIAPGAFRKTVAESDVRALLNHDPNWVLGRSKSGTLKMLEDERGLYVEIDPPDTQWARDLVQSIRRGDINQQSFGFQVIKDEWNDEKTERMIREVKLWDVSVVTYPAYEGTSANVRSMVNSMSSAAQEYFKVFIQRDPGTTEPVRHSAEREARIRRVYADLAMINPI